MQVPHLVGIEKGIVHGVHGRKAGAIWAEHPRSTTLGKLAHGLLFASPKAAQEHREDAHKGKKPKSKPPGDIAANTNPLINPKTEPLNNPKTKANPNPTPTQQNVSL